MASIICENCGTNNFENAKNCRSCLQILGLKEITRKTDEPIFLKTEFDKVPVSTEYQKPEDYEDTTGYWQRIRLVIWDRDIHAIKELANREDLQSEASYSLFIIVSLMSIFTIIDWALNPMITLSFPLLVIGVFILIFSNSYIFIFIFIYLGRLWTGSSHTMEKNFAFRPVAYVFAIRGLETFILVLANTTGEGLVGLFWFILLIYQLAVTVSVFSKIFDTRIYLGIITVLLAYLISIFLSQLITKFVLVVLFIIINLVL